MIARRLDEISRRFADRGLIEQALKEAGREALLQHKQAGLLVPVLEKGQIVWVPPERIEREQR